MGKMPTFPEVIAMLEETVKRVLAQLDELEKRLPPEVKPTEEQIRKLIEQNFDPLYLQTLRATITAEVLSVLKTGKSVVRRTPVDLA